MKTNFTPSFLLIILLVTGSMAAHSQTNHSEVYTFMQKMGWKLSDYNNFREPSSNNFTIAKFYDFEQGHRYAIVGFTKSKEARGFNVEATDTIGNPFRRNYNTRLIPALFNLEQDYAILPFYTEENIRLGIRINPSLKVNDASQLYYMIFYK